MREKRFVQAFFYNNPDNYPPIINGTRLLANAGWNVELYCRDDGKRWNVGYPDEVKIHRIKQENNASWRNYFSFCWEAMRRGNKHTSVFVGHDMHGLVPARILALRHRRPLVYHCYDYSGSGYSATAGSRSLQALQFAFARTANLMTVPDEGLAQLCFDDLRLIQRPLVVANSPLNKPISEGILRRTLVTKGHDFERVVFRPGRIGPGHGIEVTIRSIPYWSCPKWGFVVMGPAEEKYLASLGYLAASLGVEGQFAVLPPVSYDEIARFTCEADIGHALYEPIHVNNRNITGSCKIHEYMAAGRPMIVSNRPSLTSMVKQFECGLAADDSSPESVAEVVNKLLINPDWCDDLGRAGLKAFETRLRFEHQFRPVLNVMAELANME